MIYYVALSSIFAIGEAITRDKYIANRKEGEGVEEKEKGRQTSLFYRPVDLDLHRNAFDDRWHKQNIDKSHKAAGMIGGTAHRIETRAPIHIRVEVICLSFNRTDR